MAVVFLAGLQIGQVFLTFLRLPPDAPVQDAHDGHRSVEGGDGRTKSDVIVCLDELDEAFICLGSITNDKISNYNYFYLEFNVAFIIH